MTTALRLPADWMSSRKFVAGACAALCVAALVIATLYASAAVFLVLNKANPLQARLTSTLQYWTLYSPYPGQRRKLLGSLGISTFALWIVLPASLFVAARPRRSLHGDARFATVREVARAGLLPNHRGRHGMEPPSILIGRYRNRFLALPGQLSVMLSAPTRSGKGVGVVIPNLLSWPDSVVVLDVKGENYELTAGYRAEHGQAVYAFSPFDSGARSHRWNPLSTVRVSARYRISDLLAIGQVLYPNDGSGTSSEAFFNDQARNLFMGLGLLLLETPELPRTIGELLRQSSGQGRPLKDHLTALIAQRKAEATPDLPALSGECVDALQRLLSNSENTLSSVVATLNAPLTVFADAVVDAATSADDFRLQDVRRLRMSIYVRIPPNRLAAARPLLNLFFSQLVSLNTECLPSQDSSLAFQCLLVNDEFAVMGRVNAISGAAAFLAGYNLRLLTVVQAMSQLDALYGDKEARTFTTNHGLQILFAPREQRDADEYSAALGQFTQRATSIGHSRSFGWHGHGTTSRNDSEQRRALLLPQEFKELGAGRMVVLLENCKPILADKIRYYQDEVFMSRLRPPPIVPEIDIERHVACVQQRWRYLDDELPAGTRIDVDALAHDLSVLPDVLEGSPVDVSTTLADFIAGVTPEACVPDGASHGGGAIEPDPDDDGVVIDDCSNANAVVADNDPSDAERPGSAAVS